VNVDKEDRSPDYIGPKDAEIQLNIWPHGQRRRILWVIVPKPLGAVFEQELLDLATTHGKIKLHAEENGPPKPADQH
jgi:hypothetical protein